jgi:hypothetical protein
MERVKSDFETETEIINDSSSYFDLELNAVNGYSGIIPGNLFLKDFKYFETFEYLITIYLESCKNLENTDYFKIKQKLVNASIIFQSNLKVVKWLLENGSELPKDKTFYFCTNNLETLKFIYSSGAKFDSKMVKFAKQLDILKYLLEDVKLPFKTDYLDYHIKHDNDLESIKYLFERYDISKDTRITSINLEILKYLIEMGYTNDLNVRLTTYAIDGDFKMVKFFVENGIEINDLILVYVRNRDIYDYLYNRNAKTSKNDYLKPNLTLKLKRN